MHQRSDGHSDRACSIMDCQRDAGPGRHAGFPYPRHGSKTQPNGSLSLHDRPGLAILVGSPPFSSMIIAEAHVRLLLFLQRSPGERCESSCHSCAGEPIRAPTGSAPSRSAGPDPPTAVKADNPGIAFGEVGKKIGEMWAKLSADDKVRRRPGGTWGW